MARHRKNSEPAYRLVDLSILDPADRTEVIEDAVAGGADFGVKVVEINHNGPAQTNVYGVYVKGAEGEKHSDLEKWEAFLEDVGVSEDAVDEETIRAASAASADDQAAAAEQAEEAELARAGVKNRAK
jgi:hypothetical protein